jgi:hypothetical protein
LYTASANALQRANNDDIIFIKENKNGTDNAQEQGREKAVRKAE